MNSLSEHIRQEHKNIYPHLDAILTTAHGVGEVPREIQLEMVAECLSFLLHELIPHAQHEDAALYQAVERAIGAAGSTNAMKREHVGIKAYVDELSDLHGTLTRNHESSEQTIRSLRRVLYGIHALVTMHLTVEEDVYLPLLDTLPEDQQRKLISAST